MCLGGVGGYTVIFPWSFSDMRFGDMASCDCEDYCPSLSGYGRYSLYQLRIGGGQAWKGG